MIKYVKISKTTNRKVGKKEYFKHIVTVPNKFLQELNWSDKTELNMKVSGNKIVIEKK